MLMDYSPADLVYVTNLRKPEHSVCFNTQQGSEPNNEGSAYQFRYILDSTISPFGAMKIKDQTQWRQRHKRPDSRHERLERTKDFDTTVRPSKLLTEIAHHTQPTVPTSNSHLPPPTPTGS